jgi:zinc protease
MRQAHMIFGYPGPGLTDEDRYAVEVLSAVLSGMSGRIHKVLREEHSLAYATTFFNQAAYDGGAVGVYIGTDAAKVPEAERLVRQEMERITTDGVTEAEVSRAKSYLIGSHVISMQVNSAKATNMCVDTIYGLPANSFKLRPAHIGKVTVEDVNRVARKYLLQKRMVTVLVGPGE